MRKIHDDGGRRGFECDELGVVDVGHAFQGQCAPPPVQQPNAQKGGCAASGASSGREEPRSGDRQSSPCREFALCDYNGVADRDAYVIGLWWQRLVARCGRRVLRLHGDGLFAPQVGGEQCEGEEKPQQGSHRGRDPRSAARRRWPLPHRAWSVGSRPGPGGELILEELLILRARAQDRPEVGRECGAIVE